jgi:hypothetical protein
LPVQIDNEQLSRSKSNQITQQSIFTNMITQRFCHNEIQFIHLVNAIAADGFEIFSICQSLDGRWHAWIRTSEEYVQALDEAVKRGLDAHLQAERASARQKRLGSDPEDASS